MEYFTIIVLAIAIIIGFAIPIKQTNINDSPRCESSNDTEIKYHETLKYIDDIPYCDGEQSNDYIDNK